MTLRLTTQEVLAPTAHLKISTETIAPTSLQRIYAFMPDDAGEVELRERAQSSFGDPGLSSGDVLDREITKSDLTGSLSELSIPGRDGFAMDICGGDILAFACADDDGCGQLVSFARTCGLPTCDWDWAAAVTRKVIRTADKFEGLCRALDACCDGQKGTDCNHVVASEPSLLVDVNHVGVPSVADRDDLMSWLKGDLHNCYIPCCVGTARDLLRGSAETTRHPVIFEFLYMSDEWALAFKSPPLETNAKQDRTHHTLSNGDRREEPQAWTPGSSLPVHLEVSPVRGAAALSSGNLLSQTTDSRDALSDEQVRHQQSRGHRPVSLQ